MLSTSSIYLAALLPAVVRATSYSLVKDYSGTTFFDDWNFYGNCKSFSESLVHSFVSLLKGTGEA